MNNRFKTTAEAALRYIKKQYRAINPLSIEQELLVETRKESLVGKVRQFYSEHIANKESAKDSWPVLRIIGHLEGVPRRDIRTVIRGVVQRHFAEHVGETVYLSIIKWRGGWLYEAALGGDGQSRIKNISHFLDDNEPGTRLKLPAGHRFGEVYLHQEGRLVFRLLPEGNYTDYQLLPPEGMAPKLYPSYSNVLVWGASIFFVGGAFLFGGLALATIGDMEMQRQALSEEVRKQQLSQQERFQSLPVTNIPEPSLRNEPNAREFIASIKYELGAWQEPEITCVGSGCAANEPNLDNEQNDDDVEGESQ